MEEKTLVILGGTGSIGSQALEVTKSLKFVKPVGFSYHANKSLAQVMQKEFGVECVVSTENGLERALSMLEKLKPDMTLIAVPGFESLPLTLKAAEVSRRILIASKEALVCGGWLVKSSVSKNNVEMIPVDSEHSAVFQVFDSRVRSILLTSSGGALRDWELSDLQHATPKHVLSHPVWKMGKKITVDSATMVNKGFEVIEAVELFNLKADMVNVLIHRDGLIHGGVFYSDGTVKLLMSPPDMKIPLAYAMTYPERFYEFSEPLSLQNTFLSFEEVQRNRYPAFYIAYEIADNYAKRTAYNSADEIAVEAFLQQRIRFLDIPKVLTRVVQEAEGQPRDLADLIEIHEASRRRASEVIECLSFTSF